MSTAPPLLGVSAVVEVELSRIRAAAPELTPAQWGQLQGSLTRYLQGECPFSDCQRLLLATARGDAPAVHLRELLLLSGDPLPVRAPADGDGALRRRTHPWTAAEDQRLLGGILRFGLENWQTIAAFVGNGRNRAQCAQRWSRGLNPRICKREWTAQEERQLHALVAQFGEKRWAKIASILGNRSDVQCRYHSWHTAGGALRPGARSPLAGGAASLGQPAGAQWRREDPVPIAQAGACAGSAATFAPLSPIAENLRVRFTGLPLEAPMKAVPWAVVGSDPESLRLFLGRFQ
jgi:hypothetical protein